MDEKYKHKNNVGHMSVQFSAVLCCNINKFIGLFIGEWLLRDRSPGCPSQPVSIRLIVRMSVYVCRWRITVVRRTAVQFITTSSGTPVQPTGIRWRWSWRRESTFSHGTSTARWPSTPSPQLPAPWSRYASYRSEVTSVTWYDYTIRNFIMPTTLC